MSSFAHSERPSAGASSPAVARASRVAFWNARCICPARAYIARSPMRSPKRMKSSIILLPASSP